MNDITSMLELHELDQLLALARREDESPRWRRLGYTIVGRVWLERERARAAEGVERRWRAPYERSLLRYGQGMCGVRDRVCQGCFVTLPTSAAPPAGEAQLHLCQGCGRLLFWA